MDSTYILVIIGALLSMGASMLVNSAYSKYSRVRSGTGMTGAEVAKRILQAEGIMDVQVRPIAGNLTDHYDPRSRTVNLSEGVYGSASVAAVSVAAHECGHACQHAKGYLPLSIRSALVPAANMGSRLGLPMVLLGAFIGSFDVLVPIGIWVFSLSILFHLVTLPVEFNASRRALSILRNRGYMTDQDARGCRKVLTAAAMTYVAAAAASILQLLRLVLSFGNRRRD